MFWTKTLKYVLSSFKKVQLLCNLDEDDEEGTSLDGEDTLDNCEQTNQSFSQRKEDEEVCVEDKSPEPDGPSKSKKREGTN